jgi:hypothetical protein
MRRVDEDRLHQLFQRSSPGRHISVTLRSPEPDMLANHALRVTQCAVEYVRCDGLARIDIGALNKLLGTIGRAENIGSSRDHVMSLVTFSINYCQ